MPGPITRFFDGAARVYDTPLLQRVMYAPNHQVVREVLGELEPASLVDVGCGTGVFTAELAERWPDIEVHGCDPSTGMLAAARQRSARVTWHEARAEALPFPDASVEAVITTEAFHFFDQPAALAEFARILVHGGHVVIASFSVPLAPPAAVNAVSPVRFVTPAHVRGLVRDAGLTLLEQRPVSRLGALGILAPTRATVARRP